MHKLKPYALPLVFIASFLAVGVPYWLIPYSQVSLPGTLIAPGAIVVILAALILRACRIASLWKIAIIVGASAPAAVMARVTVEVASDPTSHNLWPLEIMIATVMGLLWGFGGAIAGGLLAMLVASPPRTLQAHTHRPPTLQDDGSCSRL